MEGSWAVSFGMPSKSPDIWRADVEATRRALPKHKILAVSVVATPEDHWTIDEVAEDFARCARWAVESGADCVEANFSCPNVGSADAQLYQQPEAAGCVASRLREAIGAKPLLLKIGHVTDEHLAAELSRAVTPHASALVMVNCISATVIDAGRNPLFDGQRRGIAGEAIREAALDQVRLFDRVLRRHALALQLVGVGGISCAVHVRAHLDAGAHAVQLATAAMLDPLVGMTMRRNL
jgi:dihydroorotate dehydrogenase